MLETSSAFIRESRERGVGLKSALLEYAVRERELDVERINSALVVVKSAKAEPLVFRNMNGPLSSMAGRDLCNRKHFTRRLLAAEGVSVTPSQIFQRGQRGSAWRYAQSLGLPAVLKPPSMARGRGITTAIETEEQFTAAWRKIIGAYRQPSNAQFIVEKHIYGEDYRLYVVGDRVFSATQRKRPSVVGDGVSTIGQLVDEKNILRSNHPTLLDYLIPTDPALLDRLEASGRTVESIPGDGEEVTLRSTSNLSSGGDSIDVTDKMHPSLLAAAQKSVSSIPGMEYAGVDIIATSITDSASPETHVVSEVEYSPAPITNFPIQGTPRDMGGALVDFYLQRYKRRSLLQRRNRRR